MATRQWWSSCNTGLLIRSQNGWQESPKYIYIYTYLYLYHVIYFPVIAHQQSSVNHVPIFLMAEAWKKTRIICIFSFKNKTCKKHEKLIKSTLNLSTSLRSPIHLLVLPLHPMKFHLLSASILNSKSCLIPWIPGHIQKSSWKFPWNPSDPY